VPELPEVETVRDGLARFVLDRVIQDVEVLRDYSVRRQDGGPEALVRALTGRRFTAAARRGKFLWLPLSDDGGSPGAGSSPRALLAHLGMSGQLLVHRPEATGAGWDAQDGPHVRVRMLLGPETDPLLLRFVDQRTFGHLAIVDLVPTPDGMPGGQGTDLPLVPGPAAHIARDPLDPAFDEDAVVVQVRRRRTGIKRALLDQSLVSGIGNIYADEALWRARVHFERPTATMPARTVRQVLRSATAVMSEALVAGGTSFDALYVNVNGSSGYFARSLNAYGREGEPCPRCGTPIVREAFANRSSYRCPRCQRRPRSR